MAFLELSDGQGDRQAPANKKRGNRGHESPEESLATMAGGVRRVCGRAVTVQPDGEEHLVHRIGGGVR